ncbi:nucleotide-diphospho-sugar transferase [Cryphonectria parasitica EP155]|uniref:Mannose-1-phosphate guanyltransferase n=1 Tax=Cryphonectria parasitica (strain ATCC 38755 / EP155) TaxID=660469 RepID=A0A9P4XYE4_CRYP1|nr:nucleotide-diphospho-sugar transferase [Cryphonectria parasitica EP155]KAF3763627.1 nucleotide-diphospho-sugar transferase [Cryphonectria parasitica EP155]
MSQKSGKAAAAKGKKPSGKAGNDEQREDVLQAVILADYFQDRFVPFSLEKPRCLLPLANTPLIEYTLEFLDMNGVQEVIIYTGAHTDQIESYINDHPRWSPTSKINPFTSVDFIRVSDASSVGDFLRDLDGRGLISGDFILVHGDCVANIQLETALAKHKARREANREAVMTVVLRSGGLSEHRTKSKGITPIFAMDSTSGRCLHYEEMNPLQSDHYAVLDPMIFEQEAVEIRTDLIDPGIDICTPDVLALWSESFDYELPRKNFLHGVLKDWELNGKFIYTEIVDQGYAARASNLQMYDSITRDVLGRWTYPLVPDSNLVSGQSYVMYKGNVLREKGVMFESDADISKSVFGSRTIVGSGTSIKNSVIGRRCFIGQNVTIEDSYIWDDVTIEDGTTVTRSILGTSATVGKDCTIGAGSLISFDVTISNNISIPPSTVLSVLAHDRTSVKTDLKLLGPKGKGAVYDYEEDDEEIDPTDPTQLQKSLIYSVANFNISTSSVSTLSSEVETESEDDEAGELFNQTARSRLSSFASDDSGSGINKAAFHKEAVHGLLDALRGEADDFEGAKLEFMGLRLGQDASDASVRRAVAAAFVRRAVELLSPGEGGPLEPAKAAEQAVAAKIGAAKFLREVGVGSGSVAEQVEFIMAVQKSLVSHADEVETARLGTLLAAMLQRMYNGDVVEEDGILAWWGDKRAAEGETMSGVRARCKVLVDWLEESSEEEGDDDDEDDDSD